MPLRDVGTPSLDEVVREALAETFALPAGGLRQALEVRGEQAEQPVEGSVVTTVRSRGEQDEVPGCAVGQAPEQLVPLMPALAGRGAGVGLVDDHEVGTRLEEVVSPLAGLHVVETDDRVPMYREDALARRNAPLQATRAPGGDGGGADLEPNLQLSDPLVHEMRRTEDDGAIDVAAVEQLARDEQGLDRLPYPDVVRDEQAHRIELERHEQRHELVRPRLDRDLTDAPKGSRPPPQREQQRVAQQERRVVPAELVGVRHGEPGFANRLESQRKVDERPVLVRSRDRTDPERLRRASAEDDPLAPAGADEAPRGVYRINGAGCRTSGDFHYGMLPTSPPCGDETPCPPAPSTLTPQSAASKLSTSIRVRPRPSLPLFVVGKATLPRKAISPAYALSLPAYAPRLSVGTLRWVVGIQSAITLATFAIVAAKLL